MVAPAVTSAAPADYCCKQQTIPTQRTALVSRRAQTKTVRGSPRTIYPCRVQACPVSRLSGPSTRGGVFGRIASMLFQTHVVRHELVALAHHCAPSPFMLQALQSATAKAYQSSRTVPG